MSSPLPFPFIVLPSSFFPTFHSFIFIFVFCCPLLSFHPVLFYTSFRPFTILIFPSSLSSSLYPIIFSPPYPIPANFLPLFSPSSSTLPYPLPSCPSFSHSASLDMWSKQLEIERWCRRTFFPPSFCLSLSITPPFLPQRPILSLLPYILLIGFAFPMCVFLLSFLNELNFHASRLIDL